MAYLSKSATLILNMGASPELFERARELRKTQTEAEKKLWDAIRSRKCNGLKFRRQHPWYRLILDFYCHEHLIAIEVDGRIHTLPERAEYDTFRSSMLKEFGIKVIRATNEEVLGNLDAVLDRIKQAVLSKNPPGHNEE
jgi:very-short-patch-repair endonuclease